MKFKYLLLTFPFVTLSASSFAAKLIDSIGVENQDGKKVILHKLDPKDNYYSIGRRYKVSPKAIIQFNNNAKMTIGNIIKVPTDQPFSNAPTQTVVKPVVQNKPVVAQAPVQTPPQQQPQQPPAQQTPAPPQTNSGTPGSTTQYKVSAGETLFSIAKRFNTTVDDIMKTNNLQSNNITPGEVLQIKAPTPASAPVTSPPSVVAKRDSTSVVVSNQDSSNMAAHMNANKFGLYEKDEKGVATWMDDAGLDSSKKLVLHRTAPIGTVIKITNIMTNRTTFAKVVGRFTDNEETKDVLIVMTKSVAQSLGALDKRFQVNISYGSPTE